MDTISKIFDIIKVPLRVLLPAVCLFSGFVLFANEEILRTIGLYEWKIENNFVFGLLFLVTACLLIVYGLYYVKDEVSKFIFNISYKRKTIKMIFEMNEIERNYILSLYQSEDYTKTIDYSEPVVKGLIARDLVYVGNNVFAEMYGNRMLVKATLQSYIIQSLQWYGDQIPKKIAKLERKKEHSRDIPAINKEIQELRELENILRRG